MVCVELVEEEHPVITPPQAANEELCADWAECAGTEKLTSLAPLQRHMHHRRFCFLPPERKYIFPNASVVTSAKRNCNVFIVRLCVLLCMQNDLAEAVISHRWVTAWEYIGDHDAEHKL